MATFNISTAVNIDSLASKAGGDTFNLTAAAAYLTIDQDSRYGTNQNTSAALGNMTTSTTQGGTFEFKSTGVRLIPYDTGTSTVPAYDTAITQGSASGTLLGVYSALNAAPTAVGAAMPASGYIKIRAWNTTAYAAGALTGIGASATGADVAGWLEIVGVNSLTLSATRLGTFKVTGDWFYLADTDGTRATTYQLPTNGDTAFYLPGCWVETDTASGEYEFYPCAGSQTALLANVATDAVRGKFCWISTGGVLRFGHDGTNSTGGYIPPSGRKVRVPNIFFMCCTSAAKTVNVLPNATLATRYSTYPSTIGTVILSKCSMNWFFRTSGALSVTINDCSFMTAVQVATMKSAITWSQVGIGQEAANAQIGLTLQTSFLGGTIDKLTVTRSTMGAGAQIVYLQDSSGFTFTNCRWIGVAAKSSANIQSVQLTHATNCTWTNLTVSPGAITLTSCADLTFTDTVYYDHPATTTPITNGVYIWDLTGNVTNVKIDGLSFGGLFMCQSYLSVIRTGSGQVYPEIKLRNLGTAAAPLDMGGPQRDAGTWTRATTTATITDTAHGLKSNDNIYVKISSSTAAITVASKTITVTGVDTFTFTCLNAGAASGTLSYYPRVTQSLFEIGWGAENLRVQRCYTPHLRTAAFTEGAVVTDGTIMQNVWFDGIQAPTFSHQSSYFSGLQCNPLMEGGNNVYGTHWLDVFTTGTPTNLSAQAWTRSTTTATLTSTAHGLRTGDSVVVTVSSDTAAIVLGVKSITALTADTFTFTCLNAGAASGTLTFVPMNGKIGFMGNAPNAFSAAQVSVDTGPDPFTNSGGVGATFLSTAGNKATWTTPYYLVGHTGFPIAEAVLDTAGSGLSISSFNCYYAIDLNDGNGYSAYKNLYYQRTGAGGTSGTTGVTMTDTTGVAAGDYVWGTGIAPNCKVVSITNSTTIVVDTNNTGTVSGTLRFNQLPSETGIDAQLGVGLKFRMEVLTTIASQTFAGLYVWTTSTSASRAFQYVLDPVTVKVTVKDATSGAVVSGAMVLLEAAAGGALPALESVTITRSSTTATVSHTAHGLSTNTYVRIRGAAQLEYNGSKLITVVDANSYTFTVAGSPASPATGTITSTAQIIGSTTDGSGIAQNTAFNYTADQPVTGTIRKGTSATFYRTGTIVDTIDETGMDSLVFLLRDA